MGRWIVGSLWLLVVSFLQAAPPSPAGAGPKRSDAVVQATAVAEKPANGKQIIKVTLAIDKDWHLYANPVGNDGLDAAQTRLTVSATAKPKSVKVDYPKGKLVVDPLVGNYRVYEGKIDITATVERAPGDSGPLEITVQLQACNEKTCLLPATVKLKVP